MNGKIALEEHFSNAENNRLWNSTLEASRNGKEYMADAERRLVDCELRLAEMDRFGIETAIVSLTSPGAQSILDPQLASDFARRTNDEVTKLFVEPHKGRFYAFATVALQNPRAAADELERAVKYLGMKGALINGYTNVGDPNTAQYLDEPPVWEFWERVAELNVPVYLHPREPLPAQRRLYEGYPELIGSAWVFAHETGTHAVRLMLSGLFDKYPKIQVILGHLGEGLSQLLPRLEWRLHMQCHGVRGAQNQRKVSEYYSNNFYLTTSGHFHTAALIDSMNEVGADRILFAIDYPYEYTETAATWFDHVPIAGNDRIKIGCENARQLFHLQDSAVKSSPGER
jgi:2,3-dihydroxybenzoate decarboxylase